MRSQSVIEPDVAIPAASEYVPGNAPCVVQSPVCGRGSARTWIRNTVVPYITIVSPGSRTPTEAASAQASTVPAVTGSLRGKTVSEAAAAPTVPTTSVGQASLGSSMPGATRSAQSWAQSPARRSYIGSHWLAE